MWKNYLKIAFRNLGKNKIYSVINVAGLGVGIAVTLLIGLWVKDELSFNKGHAHYDRIAQVMVNQTFNGHTGTSKALSIPAAREIQNKYSADFKYAVLASWNQTHLLSNGDTRIFKPGVYAESGLPELMSVTMLRGDVRSAIQQPGSIMLSKSTAEALFGTDDAVGKALRLDNKYDVKVTGIYKDIPFNSTFASVKLFLPWRDYGVAEPWVKRAENEWDNHSFGLYLLLNEHARIDVVSRKLRNLEKPHAQSVGENPELFLHPMERWHLYGDFKDGVTAGGEIRFVWLFSIIGIFVLVLACINFMNLSTARSEKRAREVGVRKSIGSMRSQLVGQFLTESMLVTFFALVLGLLIVLLALPSFNTLAAKRIEFPFLSPVFWIILLSFTVVTGIVAGSYPAFYLSSFHPLKVLKGTFRIGRWAAIPRKAMVVVQFTVSVTLMIGTVIVFQQIKHGKNRPVGYEREGLLQVEMVPNYYGKYYPLRDDLIKTGMVSNMSESSSPTTGIWSNQIDFHWEGKEPNTAPLFGTIACTHDFGSTVGWKMVEGRDFSRSFASDTSAMILNESAVKITGMKDVIGKTIRRGGKSYHIVGVVKDMVMNSPYEPTFPTIFMMDYEWANLINIKLAPGVPTEQALKKVEAVFKKHDPNTPFQFKFEDDEYEAKFRSEERVGELARVFAILAIFISCLGLFGLAAYTAEQRTKEIGIRKTLGASVAQMWLMLSSEFVYLVITACVVASPIALYFLNGWLSGYEYRISVSWVLFAGAGLVAIAITLLTVSFQAIRAALMNPVKSLRSE